MRLQLCTALADLLQHVFTNLVTCCTLTCLRSGFRQRMTTSDSRSWNRPCVCVRVCVHVRVRVSVRVSVHGRYGVQKRKEWGRWITTSYTLTIEHYKADSWYMKVENILFCSILWLSYQCHKTFYRPVLRTSLIVFKSMYFKG